MFLSLGLRGRAGLINQGFTLVVSGFSQSSFSDLKYLLLDSGRFLHEIQLNSSVNKMSVDNLATVIGVNLIRPQIEDPAIIMRGKRDSWNNWHRSPDTLKYFVEMKNFLR